MTDARKRIAELEEALKPFAEVAPHLPGDMPDSMVYGLEGATDWLIYGHFRRAALLLSEQTETPAQETGDVEMLPCPFCGDPPSEMHEHHQKHLPKIYWCECDGYSTQADEDDADYRTAQEWNDPEWRAPAQDPGDVERVAFLVEGLRGNTGFLAKHAKGLSLIQWDAIANCMLDSADLLEALAEMRPVSVDAQKLAEIRARHEDVESGFGDAGIDMDAFLSEAHADRAFLLSAIEGVNHDD